MRGYLHQLIRRYHKFIIGQVQDRCTIRKLVCFYHSGSCDPGTLSNIADIFWKNDTLRLLIIFGLGNEMADTFLRRICLTSRHVNDFPLHRRPLQLCFSPSMDITRRSNRGLLYRLRRRTFNLSMTWQAVFRDHAFRCDDILLYFIAMRMIDDIVQVKDISNIVVSYMFTCVVYNISLNK